MGRKRDTTYADEKVYDDSAGTKAASRLRSYAEHMINNSIGKQNMLIHLLENKVSDPPKTCN